MNGPGPRPERATIGWVGPTGFYQRAVGATFDRTLRLYQKNL
jgi:hypothetical protein